MVVGKRLKSLVKQLTEPPAAKSPWRPSDKPYPLLSEVDPAAAGLVGVPGIAAIWHLGVRPQWLRVVAARDLAAAIRSAAQNPAIISYKPNGGVYVAWAPLPLPALHGHVQHLTAILKPLLQTARLTSEVDQPPDTKPLDFPLPPGTASST